MRCVYRLVSLVSLCLICLHRLSFIFFSFYHVSSVFLGFMSTEPFWCINQKENDRRATEKHMFQASTVGKGAHIERIQIITKSGASRPTQLLIYPSWLVRIWGNQTLHNWEEARSWHCLATLPCVILPRGFAPNIAKFTFALRPSMIGLGSLHARSALNLSPMITWTRKTIVKTSRNYTEE